jgi:Protein of unknown function (DUF4254)
MIQSEAACWANEIVATQTRWTEAWHAVDEVLPQAHPWLSIAMNHRMNFDLWHEEDIARQDDLPAERIRQAKRAIDRFNQKRNDAVEETDVWILDQFPAPNPAAPLHSETPGMIIDRLSILSLKAYHMEVEARRESADESHRAQCQSKVLVLHRQRSDLRDCLRSLLLDLRDGHRQFRLYRQFKMYNDPTLNPQLYKQGTTTMS